MDTRSMAVFCDFENVALGVREARYERFDIGKVLERLLLKGSIVVKKAYCDWDRYKEFKAPMHGASFELIEIPHVRQSGKNSADIRMVVDALDLCYTKSHVDTFVIVSGDSDFSPLVSKLRENNKTVIGVGVKKSTSDLLVAACDEFIYYDDLVREQKPRRGRSAAKPAEKAAPVAEKAAPATRKVAPVVEPEATPAAKAPSRRRPRGTKAAIAAPAPAPAPAPEPEARPADDKSQEALDLVLATLEALAEERGDGETIWGSMVKQALKRQKPGFNERYFGFGSFNELLEEARARGLVVLERDAKSGGYAVRLTEN